MDITIEQLQQMAKLQEEKARRRLKSVGNRRLRQDALIMDAGRLILCMESAIEPRDIDKAVEERYGTDREFHKKCETLACLIEDWIDAERERCLRIAEGTKYLVSTIAGGKR